MGAEYTSPSEKVTRASLRASEALTGTGFVILVTVTETSLRPHNSYAKRLVYTCAVGVRIRADEAHLTVPDCTPLIIHRRGCGNGMKSREVGKIVTGKMSTSSSDIRHLPAIAVLFMIASLQILNSCERVNR